MHTTDVRRYQAPPELLKNKVIMVTGAGDGIGRAAAIAFARHGARIILLGRTVTKLEAVYDRIVALGGPEPVIHPLDLAKAGEPDCQQVADAIDQQFGRLDGLLHNAGILGDKSPIEHYDIVKNKWFGLRPPTPPAADN